MDMAGVSKLFAQMTMEELDQANRMCVGMMREHQRQRQMIAGAKFKIGDLVKFAGRGRLNLMARVERINAKTLSVRELDGMKIKWTVSPTLFTLVGA